ncbi:hypothetical protein Btru_044262 [Bulinus truncatus]|nr:hypothetical protein Btru_044262 [Bulinus truncatus]
MTFMECLKNGKGKTNDSDEKKDIGLGKNCQIPIHYQIQETCPCGKCRKSNNPSRTWCEVSILTATHLVLDTSDARAVTCRLFVDDQDSEVVTLDGLQMEQTDVNRDDCTLVCVTCDSGIYERLSSHLRELHALCKDMLKTYPSSDLTIIVSHPHGCPKQISLGHRTKRHWITNKPYARYPFHKFIYCTHDYTTATCPGSSGALVYVMGSNELHTHVHSGFNDGTNHSSKGILILRRESLTSLFQMSC